MLGLRRLKKISLQIPSVELTRRPRLFLTLARELTFFDTLFECWKEALHHSEYLKLPRAKTFQGRDSGAILRTLYQTFHPAQIINQMQKIGSRFLYPLSKGRKRALMRRVSKAISTEIPDAESALNRAYWKTSWFIKADATIHDFIRNIHLEIEKEQQLQTQIELFWHECSNLIMLRKHSDMFIPEELRAKKRKSKRSKEDRSSKNDVRNISDTVRMVRNGLLGGIWYIRYLKSKDKSLELSLNSVFSIPDYLNAAENNHFGHNMEVKSFFNNDNFNGFSGFPVVYIGGELYRQYLLLSQDKTDISTSLTFITIDTVGGWGGMVVAGAVAKELGLATAGVGFVIYQGVKMAIREVKLDIFRRAKAKYRKFLRKREKALFRAASNIMEDIDQARNEEQQKLDNHPYNVSPIKPDVDVCKILINQINEIILSDMEQLAKVDIELQGLNTESIISFKSLIISVRRKRIKRFMNKNLIFLDKYNDINDTQSLARLLRRHSFLPILRSSQLINKKLDELASLEKYNNHYMIGLSNRVFCLYGLLQKAFASLVQPITVATEYYDNVAKDWISRTQIEHRRLEVKASQVGKGIPKKIMNRGLPLFEYRNLLGRKNGKWIYENND